MRHYTRVSAAICACLLGMAGACGARAAAARQSLPDSVSTVILPDRIVAGAQATLAVIDAAGHLVPGVAVQLSSGNEVTTDPTGRAVFSAPVEPGELSAHLKNGGLVFTTMVISPPERSPEPASAGANSAVRSGITFPHLIELGNRFTLGGVGFRGDAALDRVQVGGETALVLAASPVSVVVLLSPHTAIGSVPLVVEVGGRELGSQPVSVVSLSVTGPALAPGKKGFLTVRVSGSSERVVVQVRNLSPDVVRMPGGEVMRVTTGGGELNTARIPVAGIKPGGYAVSARVVTGGAGRPDAGGAAPE